VAFGPHITYPVIAVFTSTCYVHSPFIPFHPLLSKLENKNSPLGRLQNSAVPFQRQCSCTYFKICKYNEQEEQGQGLVWLRQNGERLCLGERDNVHCPIQVKYSPGSSEGTNRNPKDCAVNGTPKRVCNIPYIYLLNLCRESWNKRWPTPEK
jgi:hypothetical protein